MGRPKKITEETESQEIETTSQGEVEIPLILSASELQKLTTEQQQLFRSKGGTSTEN